MEIVLQAQYDVAACEPNGHQSGFSATHPSPAPAASAMKPIATATDFVDELSAFKKLAKDYERGGIGGIEVGLENETFLTSVPSYTSADVVRIRYQTKASQNLFARRLNVSPSIVHQWESGQKRPSSLAAKLLSVVEKHGIAVLD